MTKKRADSGDQIAHTYVPIKAYTYLVRRSLRQATLNLPQKTGTDHRGACGRREEAKSTSLWLPKKQEPTRTWSNDFDIKNTRSETYNFETFSQADFYRVWNYTFNRVWSDYASFFYRWFASTRQQSLNSAIGRIYGNNLWQHHTILNDKRFSSRRFQGHYWHPRVTDLCTQLILF